MRRSSTTSPPPHLRQRLQLLPPLPGLPVQLLYAGLLLRQRGLPLSLLAAEVGIAVLLGGKLLDPSGRGGQPFTPFSPIIRIPQSGVTPPTTDLPCFW